MCETFADARQCVSCVRLGVSLRELGVRISGCTLCVHVYISVCVTQGCVCSLAPQGWPLLPGPASWGRGIG